MLILKIKKTKDNLIKKLTLKNRFNNYKMVLLNVIGRINEFQSA